MVNTFLWDYSNEHISLQRGIISYTDFDEFKKYLHKNITVLCTAKLNSLVLSYMTHIYIL